MTVVKRTVLFVLECGVALAVAGLVLGLGIPLMQNLGWFPGRPWNLVLILVTMIALVALATLRPGGSLRPRR